DESKATKLANLAWALLAVSLLVSFGPWGLTTLLVSPNAYADVSDPYAVNDPNSDFGRSMIEWKIESNRSRIRWMWIMAIVGAALFLPIPILAIWLRRSVLLAARIHSVLILLVWVGVTVYTLTHLHGTIYNNRY